MTRYERLFDTDWDTLGADEAADRAYAIGVAERLGEDNREHLERIYEEMTTAYEQSFVELAFKEGRQEAASAASDSDSLQDIWTGLVEENSPEIDAEELPTDDREGLAKVLDSTEVLDSVDIANIDAIDPPEFLDR